MTDPIKPGATGQYPSGRLSPHDQGGLRAAVSVVDRRIQVDFGKSVSWLSMTPDEAIAFARVLQAKAEAITVAISLMEELVKSQKENPT